MMWMRLDCQSPTHPKLIRAGAEACWLWAASICYSNLHHLDGRVDKALLPVVYPPSARRVAALTKVLCDVKLWHDHGSHIEIHDYADFQERALKDEHETLLEAKREYERDRKRQQRSVRRPSVSGTVPDTVPSTVPGTVPECPKVAPAGVRAGAVRYGTESEFDSSDLKRLFSELRMAAGGGAYVQIQHSDYDRAQGAVAWALAENPTDPSSACRASLKKFFEYATGKEAEGWPFWAWANDPGRWLAYNPANGNAVDRRRSQADAESAAHPSRRALR